MIDRVNRYYQQPASIALRRHFHDGIGLTGKYLEIFDDLRNTSGDTRTHAEHVQLPIRTYNSMAGIVGQTCITELIRLAEIGLRAEQAEQAENRINNGG